jgi:hypothetical protein
MNTIVFKGYYLTKCLYWLFGIGAIISTLIFLKLDIPTEYKFQINTTIIGFGSIFVVYLNRLEPHYIKFDSGEFTIDYSNKFIFKYGVKTYLKSEIKVSFNNNVLVLYNNLGNQAYIREKALATEDWIIIKEYFLRA